MQTLVELLIELKKIATEPDGANKLERINAIFRNPRAPAEFQVGRHYVSRLLVPHVDKHLASLDPQERVLAVTTAQLIFPRTTAARVLRRVVKDADADVRTAARKAVSDLGLTDVAPPDIRYRESRTSEVGGYNPTGWAFGIFPHDKSPQRKAKQPSRAKALEQYDLPKLADRMAVAAFCDPDLDEEGLLAFMRPGVEAGSGYVEFEIPKAKGGTRRIAAPRTPLRKIQRKILDEILAKVPVHDACHGFVPGRSTVTNAKPHERAAIVIKLDLRDFFPSVHYRRVKGLFEQLGYNEEVAGTLAGLTTYRPKVGARVVWPGVLPQGAPTSPAIANLVSRRLDRRLEKLAAKYSAVYTRYADDLTFSFAHVPDVKIGRFFWWVDAICQQEGFTERDDKRRILRAKHQQRVTGLVVNQRVNVPRADRRRFRAMLHNCAKHGLASQARGHEDFGAFLAGYAAYVNMVDPDLGKQYMDAVAKLLGGE